MKKEYHFGLLGYPLSHSYSAKIHARLLDVCHLSGEYILHSIAPENNEEIDTLLDKIRSGQIDGINVTIPYKQFVIPKLDSLTERAKLIGAVNTIYCEGEKLIGENTDAPGFRKDLLELIDIGHPVINALVIGAGGAACAVVSELLNLNATINITDLDQQKVDNLKSHFANNNGLENLDKIQIIPTPFESSIDLSTINLIINATPVGMHPKTEHSPWPIPFDLPGEAYVYDLVYNPLKTSLIKRAESEGLRAKSGLGMLVEQAKLAFSIWTKMDLPGEVESIDWPKELGISGVQI